jgi:hypothetical protein
MAGTVFKNIDKQRYKKIYPAKRHVPVVVKQSVKNIVIETASLTFSESSSATTSTYTFKQPYESIPNVTYGVTSTTGDMVLVKITSLTVTTVIVEISAPFDGSVDLQIMEISA